MMGAPRLRGEGSGVRTGWLLTLPAPGALPDEQCGLSPDPGAHSNAGSKHGKQVDLLHQEARTILDFTVRDGLLGGQPDGHIGLASMVRSGRQVRLDGSPGWVSRQSLNSTALICSPGCSLESPGSF